MTRKLPVWPAAFAIWHHLYEEAGYAIKIVVPWIVFALALPLSVSTATGGNKILLTTVLYIFPLGWLAVAVLWHRRYLVRGASSLTPVQLFFVSFAYGLQLFGVVLVTIIAFSPILYAVLLGVAAIMGLTIEDLKTGAIIGLGLVIAGLAVVMVSLRIGLALPARTLGDDQLGKRNSWVRTQDHGFRLLCVWILVALPPFVLAILCFTIPSAGNGVFSAIPPMVRLIVAACIISISWLNTLSVLSIAYDFLVEKEDSLVPFAPVARSIVSQPQGSSNVPSFPAS